MTQSRPCLSIAVLFISMVIATPCMAQTGACCYPPHWQCFILTEEECATHEGYYFIPEGVCEPPP